MPSADATLRNSIQVGITPPTASRTLLDLLNLYASDNTDLQTWINTLESHSVTLLPFLAVKPPKVLVSWHEAFTLEDFKRGAILLANEVQPGGGTAELSGSNQNKSRLAYSLGQLIDPELAQQAALTCRLIDPKLSIPDPEVTDALTYYDRALPTLHGSPLLTRLVAVSHHCDVTAEPDIDECAALLFLTPVQINAALSDSGTSDPLPDDTTEFEQALITANLIDSSVAMARQTNRDATIQSLATGLFGARGCIVFTENSTGWFNQSHQLASPKSIISEAATRGEPVSSDDTITVADEQVLDTIGSKSGLAIPVHILHNDASVCIAVTLISLPQRALATTTSNLKLIEQFQNVARHLFTATLDRGIDAETVDRRAREIIHEANNPISTVQNYLKVLSLKLGPEHEAQETLESISSELFRAAEIVKSFNDLKHSTENQPGVCEVNKIVRQIGTLFDRGQDIDFEYQLDDSNPSAQIRDNNLKQILTNLIKNAAESSSRGDTITLCTAGKLMQGGATFVELVVRDTGAGVPGDIGNIFDRGITTKSGEHIGEGLAVVRQLTEAASGFVSYRSGPNGTEFRITIPQL